MRSEAGETSAADELLGRDHFLGMLTELVAGHQGAALLVRGERGIGRSACLQAATTMARSRGRLVLATAGSRNETHLPFAGLHRLLRPLLRSAGTLPDGQRRSLLAALGLRDAASRDSLVVRIAVLKLLTDAALDRGLLITVDDAQWLDEDTRLVLGFLVRRLEGHRIVLIAGSSAVEDDLLLGTAGREIVLDRLSTADAHRFLGQRAGHLGRAHRLWVVDRAAGNPLALRELALTAPSVDLDHSQPQDVVPWLTDRLERAFAGRVAELDGSGRDVLLVAALAADPTLPVVLAAAAMLRHPVDTDVLELAERLGLCALDDRRVLFHHPLVRAAIVQQESMSRRHAAHRALGAVLPPGSHQGVWHRALGASTPDDDVAAELEATALENVRRGNSSSAVPALERAAQLGSGTGDRGRRLIQAAWHAARLGQSDTVQRLLGVLSNLRLSSPDQIRADLIRDEFDVVVIADGERVLQWCALARWAAAAGEQQLQLDLLEAAARARCMSPLDAPVLAELLARIAPLTPSPGQARTAAVLALADPVGRGRELLAALAVADEAAPTDGDELTAYGVAARAVGDYAAAARFFDRAEVPLRARGLVGPLARNLCVVADLRVDLGEWDRASAALSGFSRLSEAAMSGSHRASVLATRAKLAALRGDGAVALELVGEVEHSPNIRGGNRFLARAQIARGIACLSAGRPADAFTALSRVFDPADPSHHFREQFDGVCYLAEAAAHTSRHRDARRVVARLRRVADESGSPFLLAHLAYADAVLAVGDTAEQLFLTALTADAGGSSWHRARTQLSFGRWLRRQHRVTESRSWLLRSLEVFQRLGAATWTAEAVDELGAAGLAVADAAVGGAEPLSAQESTIAHLAARGLTNRQIGEQLYLSPRTVSSHLYRLFPKLGISTRAQIATRLAEVSAVSHMSRG